MALRSSAYTTRDGSIVTKRQRYERYKGALWSERSSFDSHWRELADYFMPRRPRWFTSDRNRGDKRNQNIIDSTGRFAARTLQAGMHVGLTSPARPWFKLTTPDPTLAKFKPVAEWLSVVTERMAVVFADSNLYNVLPTLYGDMGVFGTSAMGVMEDSEDLFRCYSYPIGSYALAVNGRNVVQTFVREYELSVEQLVEQFGVRPGYRDIDWTNISTAVRDRWDQGDYNAPVTLCWMVRPNEDYDPRRLEARYKRFVSCHWELGSQKDSDSPRGFLRESGFDAFPVMAPRWEATGEDAYGSDSPGMTTLGDNKQLQIQQKKKGQAIVKMVDPPLKGSPELRTQKTSLLSGDITYVRDPDKSLMPVHEVRMDLSHLTLDMQETRTRIQRGFYEDLFLMIARSDDRLGADRPTAREIEERHEEKLIALGPVVERTDDELLDPIVNRVYLLMEQANLLPDAPDELDGVALKVEYTSILAEAMKLAGVATQDRFLASTGALIEAFPQVRHKIKVFRVVDRYGEMLGVEPDIIASDDEAMAAANAEAQAQQSMQAAQTAQMMGRAVKDAAAAPLGKDSTLDRVVQAAAAAGQGV